MGRPYQEKFAGVHWETNEEHLQAWKDGKTGVPIVDAAMRQGKKMGWMHNRVRMIAAMYLVKDLMIDWRLGEKVSASVSLWHSWSELYNLAFYGDIDRWRPSLE